MTGRCPGLAPCLSFPALFLVSGLVWLASSVHSFGAEPVRSPQTVVVTNYLVVTNIFVVTNYVISTNVVLTTNATSSAGDLAAGGTNSLPHDLGWAPPADAFDWIQLKSGEWLKGKIKAMQDRRLEFDSEELKLQSFDWRDVRRLRSPHVTDVMFENRTTASGPVEVTPDEVKISGDEPRTVPRRELLSLTPGGSKERNYWTGKISAGATFRSGNSKEVNYTASAELQRRSPATRLRVTYVGNFSQTEGVQTADRQQANSTFDIWLSRHFFVRAPSAEYVHDRFQNIAHRVTGGVGLGYDILDRPGLEWNVTAGPAYQQIWFDSVETGQRETRGAAALVFTSRFDWEITPRIDLILEYRGQYTSREAGETAHHGESTLSLELSRRLDLDVSLYWDRISFPKPNADGTVPKPDDFRMVLKLGVDF
jgi:putative salt-induced outer membrane protein YdiY